MDCKICGVDMEEGACPECGYSDTPQEVEPEDAPEVAEDPGVPEEPVTNGDMLSSMLNQ